MDKSGKASCAYTRSRLSGLAPNECALAGRRLCPQRGHSQLHGNPRVDDRREISGIILFLRNGPRWSDAPEIYGPQKNLLQLLVRWSRKGVFDRIFSGLAGSEEEPGIVTIDATYLKAHRTACCLARKMGLFRAVLAEPKALNHKLHALCDDKGRPILLSLGEGQLSDHVGAKLIYPAIPNAKVPFGDKGYDSGELRARNIKACIPPRGQAEPRRAATPRPCKSSVTELRTRSQSWRTGCGSQPDTTAAHIHPCRQTVSQQQ